MNSKLQQAFNVVVKYGFCGDCRWNFESSDCVRNDCYENCVSVIQDALDRIDAPTVKVEPHQWIPVTCHEADEEEKESYQWWFDEFGDDEPLYIFDCPLPDDEQDVLITSKWGNVYSVRASWNGHGFIGDEDGNEWENDVTAWMPLPKPYKKDGGK